MFASKGGNIAYGNTQYGVITLLKLPKPLGFIPHLVRIGRFPVQTPLRLRVLSRA